MEEPLFKVNTTPFFKHALIGEGLESKKNLLRNSSTKNGKQMEEDIDLDLEIAIQYKEF